jgi:hypothetical protein
MVGFNGNKLIYLQPKSVYECNLKQTDQSQRLQEFEAFGIRRFGILGIDETIHKKTTFLVPPFPFVKEDKDKDEKPKATGLIEFLLKQRADSNATARSKVLRRDCCIMD